MRAQAVLRALLAADTSTKGMSARQVAKAIHWPQFLTARILAQFEDAGIVSGSWQYQPLAVLHIPRTRLYTLTDTGRAHVVTGGVPR